MRAFILCAFPIFPDRYVGGQFWAFPVFFLKYFKLAELGAEVLSKDPRFCENFSVPRECSHTKKSSTLKRADVAPAGTDGSAFSGASLFRGAPIGYNTGADFRNQRAQATSY